jgi:hypothetical protein
MQLAAGPEPGSTIQPRLINSIGFDKATPPVIQQALTIAPFGRGNLHFMGLLTHFSQGGFTTCLVAATEMAAGTQIR